MIHMDMILNYDISLALYLITKISITYEIN